MPPAAGVPMATAIVPAYQPRAFRTPERAGGPAFVAPQPAAPAPAAPDGGAVMPMPGSAANPSRGTSGVVIFRVSSRAAIEGFDLRVAYPRSMGTFAAGQQADCSAGSSAMVAGSDRGDGMLHLIVASGRDLPLPVDVVCRFGIAAGAALDASAFSVQVAEVTSDGKASDPSLLSVGVSAR